MIKANREVLYKDGLEMQVLDRYSAQTITHDKPYFVISITDPSCYACDLAQSSSKKAVLRLVFEDSDDSERGMSVDQALQVRDFVLRQVKRGITRCVVQCEMGISRSAGVAAAISKHINDDDSLFFSYFIPNMNCYRKVLDAFAGTYDNY